MGISKSQMKRIISVLINVGVKGHFSMQGMEVFGKVNVLSLACDCYFVCNDVLSW